MGSQDHSIAAWLATSDGQQALRRAMVARADHRGDPAAAASSIRRTFPDLSSAECASVLSQAELRELAVHKYGIDAHHLLLTRDGLEQATRPEVSRARIRMLDLAAEGRVLDATAGLGFDAMAFAAAGQQVTAVERDPAIAAFLRANAPGTRVLEGDITDPAVLGLATVGMSPTDLVFIDPSRRSGARSRDGSRARPERDPQRWSPPWSFVEGLAGRFRVCAKVAPGFPPGSVPATWQAAWLATGSGPVEASLVSWPALPAKRRACAITKEGMDVVDDDRLGPSAAAGIGTWLHEPAQVVVTADLVDSLARAAGLDRLGPGTHWLTSDESLDPCGSTRLLASYRILDELPTAPKPMRAALRSRGIPDVTIKSRGIRPDAQGWRERLRLPEGSSAIVAILELAGSTHAYLVERHR